MRWSRATAHVVHKTNPGHPVRFLRRCARREARCRADAAAGRSDGSAGARDLHAEFRRWAELRVDSSEQHAALVDLARQCDDFDVRMEHLTVGDYCLDRSIVVERKTHADFAVSLVDGRLFPQAAKLLRCPHRPIILIEGPRPAHMPDVHPHALKGAIVSLAVMWRLRSSMRAIPKTRSGSCAVSQISSARRTMAFSSGMTGSPSVWLRASFTCCRVFQVSVPRWRIACCRSSDQSNGL